MSNERQTPAAPPSSLTSPGDGAGAAGPARGLPAGVPPALRADPHPGLRSALVHGAYDLAWTCAGLLASPWLLWKGRRDPAFRALVRERAGWSPPPPKTLAGRTVLIHGVSVGEVKGAAPLVDALAALPGALEIVVSATTNTGTKVAHDLFPDRRVARFPIDTRRAMRRFLAGVKPDLVVLIDLEVWPNFLRECNRAGVPVAVVNGRITERSLARHGRFHRLMPQFSRLSLVCVQDEQYAARFRAVGVDPRRIVVTGSMKADRLPIGPVDPGAELTRLLGAPRGVPVIVAGSTHEPEEALVVDAWRRGAPGARLVLVPRHPERAPEIVRALERDGVRAQRLTALRAGEAPDPARPCLADTIGELERIYGLADLVFVGGSLIPHGGQNLLEPAAQGKAVVCGPHVANFAREAALLVARGACLQVPDADALAAALADLSADPARRTTMAARGLEVVAAEKGATALTVRALAGLGLEG